MGRFMDEISGFLQEISSPDRNIVATLSGNTGIAISIKENAYEEYRVDQLESQLVNLLQRSWAVRRSARNRALSNAIGRPVRDREPQSSQERRFREERSKLLGIGVTEHIEIVFSTDDAHWEVCIEPDTIEELDHLAFLEELQAAISEAVTDIRDQIANLKDHIYYGHPLIERN